MMRVLILLLVAISVLLVELVSGQNPSHSIEVLQPQYLTEYGSKRVKTKYGPYSVPTNDMKHHQEDSIELPCHDCLITWIQAGLEYSDGTVADSTNHMWLHHMFLTNRNRESKSCPEQGYDRFFATGEERTVVNICANGYLHPNSSLPLIDTDIIDSKEKAGYYIAPSDTITMATEVMNIKQDPEPVNVTVTMTWEYVPGIPSSFSQVEAYWLDINGCGPSAQPAYPDTSFNYTSKRFISGSTGHITFMGSHLHDGGTHLEIQKNDVVICNTTASYHEGESHISSISSCTSDTSLSSPPLLGGTQDQTSNINVSQNDTLSIIAYYDTSLHKPMSFHPTSSSNSNSDPDTSSSNPTLEPIMGITLLYIALDPTKPNQTDSRSPPSKTLLLSLLFLALAAITIVTLSRMYTEKKTFTDLCPHLTPCLGLYLLIQDRFLPSSWRSKGYYYDDIYDEEDGYYEDEDEDGDRYGGEEGINLKVRTNVKGKGKEDGNGTISRPLLSVKERVRQQKEAREDGFDEEEEDGDQAKGGWDWDYENENENEQDQDQELEHEYGNGDVNGQGSGSGSKRS